MCSGDPIVQDRVCCEQSCSETGQIDNRKNLKDAMQPIASEQTADNFESDQASYGEVEEIIPLPRWHLIPSRMSPVVKTNDITSCNRTVYITCDIYKIVIVEVNTTSNIAPDLLEMCSARHQCHVPNINEECVTVNYWCKTSQYNLEMVKSSITRWKTNQPLLGIMSEDYTRGKYQTAENVNCTIQMAEHDQTTNKSWTFAIYEFAPFISSSEFCLTVLNSSQPPFCSGSRMGYTTYGPFDGNDGLQFNFQVGQAVVEVPAVRYWMDIDVPAVETLGYQLNCHSQPVSSQPASEFNTIGPSYAASTTGEMGTSQKCDSTSTALKKAVVVVSTFLFLTVLIIMFGIIVFCRERNVQCPFNVFYKDKNKEDELIYTYIHFTEEAFFREGILAPSLMRATQETESVSQGVEEIAQAIPTQSILSLNSMMKNIDLTTREDETCQSIPKITRKVGSALKGSREANTETTHFFPAHFGDNMARELKDIEVDHICKVTLEGAAGHTSADNHCKNNSISPSKMNAVENYKCQEVHDYLDLIGNEEDLQPQNAVIQIHTDKDQHMYDCAWSLTEPCAQWASDNLAYSYTTQEEIMSADQGKKFENMVKEIQAHAEQNRLEEDSDSSEDDYDFAWSMTEPCAGLEKETSIHSYSILRAMKRGKLKRALRKIRNSQDYIELIQDETEDSEILNAVIHAASSFSYRQTSKSNDDQLTQQHDYLELRGDQDDMHRIISAIQFHNERDCLGENSDSSEHEYDSAWSMTEPCNGWTFNDNVNSYTIQGNTMSKSDREQYIPKSTGKPFRRGSIMDYYTLLCSFESCNNNANNTFSTHDNLKSTGAACVGESRDQPTSQEIHDYLEVLANQEYLESSTTLNNQLEDNYDSCSLANELISQSNVTVETTGGIAMNYCDDTHTPHMSSNINKNTNHSQETDGHTSQALHRNFKLNEDQVDLKEPNAAIHVHPCGESIDPSEHEYDLVQRMTDASANCESADHAYTTLYNTTSHGEEYGQETTENQASKIHEDALEHEIDGHQHDEPSDDAFAQVQPDQGQFDEMSPVETFGSLVVYSDKVYAVLDDIEKDSHVPVHEDESDETCSAQGFDGDLALKRDVDLVNAEIQVIAEQIHDKQKETSGGKITLNASPP